MHRASKHTSSLVHTDLKSLPVNDNEPCCQLSNLEYQVLYSLGLECSQACQKAWKQKHALYMCMGPHPVRGFHPVSGFWRSFSHWCPSFPPLFLILKSSWLVKKGNLQLPPALWCYAYSNLHTLPMQNPDTFPSLPPFVSAWSQLQRRVSDCLIPQVSETLGLLPSTSASLLPLTDATTLSSQVLFNTDMYCRTHRKKKNQTCFAFQIQMPKLWPS